MPARRPDVTSRLWQEGSRLQDPLEIKFLRGQVLKPVLLTNRDSYITISVKIAGWSSQVARRAHNPKVGGSNPSPATKGGVAQLVRAAES